MPRRGARVSDDKIRKTVLEICAALDLETTNVTFRSLTAKLKVKLPGVDLKAKKADIKEYIFEAFSAAEEAKAQSESSEEEIEFSEADADSEAIESEEEDEEEEESKSKSQSKRKSKSKKKKKKTKKKTKKKKDRKKRKASAVSSDDSCEESEEENVVHVRKKARVKTQAEIDEAASLKLALAMQMSMGRPRRVASDSSRLSSMRRAGKVKSATKKPNNRFKKIMSLSEELQAVIGVEKATRGEVQAELWKYIKKKKLQDPADGRVILPKKDRKMYEVFQVDRMTMFQMTKLLSQDKHVFHEQEVV